MIFVRRVVLLALFNDSGKVLLQHRCDDARRAPGLWGFFGGGIEDGETPEEALVRELKEELEIEIKDFKFFKRYEHETKEGLIEKFLYTAKSKWTEQQLRAQQHECQGLGFFFYKDTISMAISANNKVVLKELLDTGLFQ